MSDNSATHAVLCGSHFGIPDLGTLGGSESRALRVGSGVLGESRTVEGDLHPVRWWLDSGLPGRLADVAHVLGTDSQIELVVPFTGDFGEQGNVVSGAASPGADVHAYIVSVPRVVNNPGTPQTY